jgi:hypothetical protein
MRDKQHTTLMEGHKAMCPHFLLLKYFKSFNKIMT